VKEVSVSDLSTTTGDIFRLYRWRLALTYSVTAVENLLEVLYPLMIGIAIDGLLDGEPASLLPFILTWVIHALLSAARQLYDARTFARIYHQLASGVVTAQGKQGVTTSHLAARSGLMREFVDYLEADIPFIIAILISFVGAFVLLVLFDFVIGAYCLLMLIPSFLLNRMHSRTTRRLNRGLNDDLEREITVIETRPSLRIDEHFGRVSRWYIRLSHADVRAWLLIQPFFIGLIVLALARSVSLNMEPGDIFAVVAYALRFTDSLDQAPLIVQQYSRLQDITERINSGGVTAE